MTGDTTTYYLAECQDCSPILPQPFSVEAQRDEWARIHGDATGHRVSLRAELHFIQDRP